MKSKIVVDIHKEGNSNLIVLKAIGRHNGGDNLIDQQMITGYVLGQKIDYPSLYKEIKVTQDGDTLHISEDDGKTFTLSLTWTEVHELQPVEDAITN